MIRKAKKRERFESEEDRRNEAYVAEQIGLKWGVELKKNPNTPEIDYSICGNKRTLKGMVVLDVLGMAEIKCRTNSSHFYDTYMISAKKWSECRNMALGIRLPVYLFVEFADRIMYIKCTKKITEKCDKVWLGRNVKKRDDLDEESCIMIPMEYFKTFLIYEKNG